MARFDFTHNIKKNIMKLLLFVLLSRKVADNEVCFIEL